MIDITGKQLLKVLLAIILIGMVIVGALAL